MEKEEIDWKKHNEEFYARLEKEFGGGMSGYTFIHWMLEMCYEAADLRFAKDAETLLKDLRQLKQELKGFYKEISDVGLHGRMKQHYASFFEKRINDLLKRDYHWHSQHRYTDRILEWVDEGYDLETLLFIHDTFENFAENVGYCGDYFNTSGFDGGKGPYADLVTVLRGKLENQMLHSQIKQLREENEILRGEEE